MIIFLSIVVLCIALYGVRYKMAGFSKDPLAQPRLLDLRLSAEQLLDWAPSSIEQRAGKHQNFTTRVFAIEKQVTMEIIYSTGMPSGDVVQWDVKAADKNKSRLGAMLFKSMQPFKKYQSRWHKYFPNRLWELDQLYYRHQGDEVVMGLSISPSLGSFSSALIVYWIDEMLKVARATKFQRAQDELWIDLFHKISLNKRDDMAATLLLIKSPTSKIQSWAFRHLDLSGDTIKTHVSRRQRSDPLIPWFDNTHRQQFIENQSYAIGEIHALLHRVDPTKGTQWIEHCIESKLLKINDIQDNLIEETLKRYAVASQDAALVLYCQSLLDQLKKKRIWHDILMIKDGQHKPFEEIQAHWNTHRDLFTSDIMVMLLHWTLETDVITKSQEMLWLLDFMTHLETRTGTLRSPEVLAYIQLIFYLNQDPDVNAACARIIRQAHDGDAHAIPWFNDDLSALRALFERLHVMRDENTALLADPNIKPKVIYWWCRLIYAQAQNPLELVRDILAMIQDRKSHWSKDTSLAQSVSAYILTHHVHTELIHRQATKEVLLWPVVLFEDHIIEHYFQTISLMPEANKSGWIADGGALLVTYLFSLFDEHESHPHIDVLCTWLTESGAGVVMNRCKTWMIQPMPKHAPMVQSIMDAIEARNRAAAGSLSISDEDVLLGALSPVSIQGGLSPVARPGALIVTDSEEA